MIVPSILFIGGKGGVGKSTLASAFANLSANRNKRTLLISTDPAHNLSDIFNFIPSSSAQEVRQNLFVLEIDPLKEVSDYIDFVAKATKNFISASSYAMLDAYYANVKENGVAQESALFDRLIQIVVQESWDQIVVDTAPTGHTLRLFSLPRTLREWSKTLLKKQEESKHLENIIGHIENANPLQERIEERYLRYTQFFHLLHSPKLGIMFALNPEWLSIQETRRAIEALRQEKIKPYALLINKIPPDSHDIFFKERFELSKKYLLEIHEFFQDIFLCEIPLHKSDILESDGLEYITQVLARSFA